MKKLNIVALIAMIAVFAAYAGTISANSQADNSCKVAEALLQDIDYSLSSNLPELEYLIAEIGDTDQPFFAVRFHDWAKHILEEDFDSGVNLLSILGVLGNDLLLPPDSLIGALHQYHLKAEAEYEQPKYITSVWWWDARAYNLMINHQRMSVWKFAVEYMIQQSC